MSSARWLQVAVTVIAVGVVTTTLAANSIGDTVVLANAAAAGVHVPESAALCAVGAMLVGLARSAERVARR